MGNQNGKPLNWFFKDGTPTPGTKRRLDAEAEARNQQLLKQQQTYDPTKKKHFVKLPPIVVVEAPPPPTAGGSDCRLLGRRRRRYPKLNHYLPTESFMEDTSIISELPASSVPPTDVEEEVNGAKKSAGGEYFRVKLSKLCTTVCLEFVDLLMCIYCGLFRWFWSSSRRR
jgi:hypothetical protein